MSCPDCPRAPRRRLWALLVGLVVLAVALAVATAEGGPRRRGRSERVERPRFATPDSVRVCSLVSPDDKLTCYGGPAPPIGTHFVVVDEQGVRGGGVVERVEVSSQDTCRLAATHDVYLSLDQPLVQRQGYTTSVGVEGVSFDPRGMVRSDPNLRSPSGRDIEQIWLSLDRDGDNRVDMAATYFDCSAEVHDLPVAPTGQRVMPYCLEYWLRDGADWKRVNRDVYYNCF
jgi:hypothetical protein